MDEKNDTDEITLTFAYAADWTGLYIDRKLIYESHSITAYQLAEILLEFKKTIKEINCLSVNSKWLNDIGNFPLYLDDVIIEQ